jgi:predicted nucleic-acid-binding protein
MRITADTNVLVRALMGDDAGQSRAARDALAGAALVAVGMPALCELVWVLARGYRVAVADIARAIRVLVAAENVAVDRPAVAAGLEMLEAGGDFADGVIAYKGRVLGGETFVSFDRQAVRLLGERARLLG